MNKPILLLFLLIFSIGVSAQVKIVDQREQTWFAYFNQTRLTNKSGIWADIHLRMNGNFLDENALNIGRLGYTYYITDQVRATLGYAYVVQYSHTTAAPNIPEHRPWQQIQWFEKKSWFTMMQYVRLEERFRRKVAAGELISDYDFNYRVRYNMSFTIPLKGKQVAPKVPFIFINDELHVNFGKEIVNNYFDQNRLFVGLGYQFTQHLNAHVGYMNVFQQLPATNTFRNINAIRLFVFHNLDFRSKED